MADSPANRAWEHWQQSAEKLDYFIVGVASALTAYFGQHYSPHALGLNPATAELASIVLIGSSFIAGIDRLRSMATMYANDSSRRRLYNRANKARAESLSRKEDAIVDVATARVTVLEGQLSSERAEAQGREAEIQYYRWRRRAARSYRVRDTLLVLGICVYLTSKLWSAAALR